MSFIGTREEHGPALRNNFCRGAEMLRSFPRLNRNLFRPPFVAMPPASTASVQWEWHTGQSTAARTLLLNRSMPRHLVARFAGCKVTEECSVVGADRRRPRAAGPPPPRAQPLCPPSSGGFPPPKGEHTGTPGSTNRHTPSALNPPTPRPRPVHYMSDTPSVHCRSRYFAPPLGA